MTQAQAMPGGRVKLALILGGLTAIGPFSLDLYLPALPKIAEELQTTTSIVQLSLTACLLGLAMGQLLMGPLSDVKGRKLPLFIGLLIFTVVSLLCMFSPSVWAFIGLRFIQGLVGSSGIVIARAMARDLYSGVELTKFISILMLVNGFAPIAAPIIGAQLLNVTDWRGLFIFLTLFGLVISFAVILGLKETLPLEKRAAGGIGQTMRTFATVLRDRQFTGYALAQGFILAGMFAYISGSPFVLQDIFGVSPQMFSVIFACNGLGIIVASQVAGRMAGKVSEQKILMTGLLLAVCGGISLLICIAAGVGLKGILPSLFFVVASVGLVSTASFPLAMRNHGRSAGTASALIGVMSFVFGGLVAPLVGLGGSTTALPMGIVIASTGLLALISVFVIAGKGQAERSKS